MNKEFCIKFSVKTSPQKEGWYDTDKGTLFFFHKQNKWSCRDDRLSDEYPKWYLIKTETTEDEILGDFAEAERRLLNLDPSGESLDATSVYEVLESFRDKLLGNEG